MQNEPSNAIDPDLLSQLNHPDIFFIVYTGKGTTKGYTPNLERNTIDNI